MYSLLFLGIASFVLSLFLTPIVRNIFLRLGVVDRPDRERKFHSRPIVRVGGVAIGLSYMLAFALLLIANFKAGIIIRGALPLICKLFPAAILMFLTGFLDDLINLNPWQKLIGQVTAATVAYIGGIQVLAVNGKHFAHWWSFPITILWLLATSNAVNLIDGVDGVATGIGLFATATITLAALMQHNVELGLATVPLAGCLLAFLRYNFNPATIFLGDCGSLLIGFLLGCYSVLWSQKSATILGMTAPLLALSIPLLDTLLAVVRRFLRRRPIFGADRGHIHHRLLERGLTPRRVALLLYGICIFAGLFSLSMLNHEYEVPVLMAFCIALCVGVSLLRFTEFDTVARMILDGAFRRLLNLQLSLGSFEKSLDSAATPDECWTVLNDVYREFGFSGIRMQLAGKLYATPSEQCGRELMCSLEIPLSLEDRVYFIREFNTSVKQNPVLPFADVVQRTLVSKFVSQPARIPPASELNLPALGPAAKSACAAS